MMLRAASAILICLLLPQVNGLITTDAKCSAGHEWMFSSIGQSPCDVAAELAAVCVGGQYNLAPLDPGYIYAGPTLSNQNGCRCSSVYYSLLSSCAYCQGRNFERWSVYNANCSMVYLAVYNQQLPVGVKVPAYAYQNVLVSDGFNVTLAQSTSGTESSRPPYSGTSTSSASASSSGIHYGGSTNTAAIIGGVIGGVAFLGILSALVAYLLMRSRRKRKSQGHKSSVQESPKMGFPTPTTPGPAPLISPAMSPAPGAATKVYDPNDPSTYPAVPYNPYRHQSPPLNHSMTPNYTGNGAPHSLPSPTMPQNTGGHSSYTGVPEL